MEEIGVQAVVRGMSSFMGYMGSMDKAIRGIISPTNILGGTFSWLGGIISSVASGAMRVLEYTLGNLLASAIKAVVGQIKELISGTIEAGDEFQTLSLRLDTLNFNAKFEETQDFTKAQEYATKATKEQLSWLQKLANTTPYDNKDISNVYTLARSYSFADKESRKLTEDVANFASGMGLGSTEIERIVVNMGQMVQQGKVTQREMNDLARGAFVPVNDVLKIMQEQTKKTGKEFDEFRKTGEGVDAFMAAFSTLVKERFSSSAQKMARTFGAATNNAKDLVKSLLGLQVVKPILDVLGGRVADFMDVLNKPFALKLGGVDAGGMTTRFDEMVKLANRIGTSISDIITKVTGLGPDAEGLADKLLAGLDGIADWLDEHSDDIVDWAKDAVSWVKDKLVPAFFDMKDMLFGSEEREGAVQKFAKWLKDDFIPFVQGQAIPAIEDVFNAITGNKKERQPTDINGNKATDKADQEGPLIKITDALISMASVVPILMTLIGPLLELLGAFGNVIAEALGTTEPKNFADFVSGDLIPAIKDLTKWVNENKETLAFFLKALIALEVISVIVFLFAALVIQVSAVLMAFGSLVIASVIVGSVIAIVKLLEARIILTKTAIKLALQAMIGSFVSWKNDIIKTISSVINAMKNGDWAGVGQAVIDGITNYISSHITVVADILKKLMQNAIDAAQATIGAHSPSTVFEQIAKNTINGYVKGIVDNVSRARSIMESAMGRIISPAMAMPSIAYSAAMMPATTTTNNTNNNYNLNVNTQARTEPILMDFAMMRSLGG